MTAMEAIWARRSVRKFTDAPVPDEMIKTLLESAMAAPSACNMRPWEFYVVKNAALREQLRLASRYTNMNSSLMIVVAGNDKRSLTHKENDFWIQDCSAATENILLSATELGLGACWCGLLPVATPVKKVRKLLSLEEHIIPMALIQLGYPAETPEPRTQYDEARVHVFE